MSQFALPIFVAYVALATISMAETVDGDSAALSVDTKPKSLTLIRPEYPSRLIGQDLEGKVILQFIVDTNGTAKEIAVVQSTHPEFSKAAVASVTGTLWEAATINGQPVASRVMLPISFRLNRVASKVDTLPKALSPIVPKYPKKLRKSGLAGEVTIKLTIGADGRAHDIKVETTDHELFASSAVKALKQAKWTPATVDNQPVSHAMALSFAFSLE